jgi:signal transduction histidine kinase
MRSGDAAATVGEVRIVAAGGTRRGLPGLAALRERAWPVLVVPAVCTGLAVAGMALGRAPLAVGVLLALAGYLVASRLPRRLSVPATGAAGTALGAALWYAASAGNGTPLAGGAVEGFLPLAAAWFTGDAVALRRRYLAGVAEQAERERAAEAERARGQVREERVRIARELHDVVAHALTVITVQAGVGRRLMAGRPQEAGSALESIEVIGRTAQEELRVVLGLLREEGAGAAELSPAPRLADLEELAATVRTSGMPVELRVAGTSRQLSPAVELTVYRVVQEALTNVVRHAPGARATVDVAVCGTGVRIEVTDDGNPALRPGSPAVVPGHGIAGMRERIGAFGGSVIRGDDPDSVPAHDDTVAPGRRHWLGSQSSQGRRAPRVAGPAPA